MELTIGERFGLLGILPNEGDFVTLKLVRNLQEKLSVNEDDFKKYGILTEGEEYTVQDGVVRVVKEGGVRWAPESADLVDDIEIGGKTLSIVVGILEKLSNENKLSMQHISLFEKFVGE